jgi:hypothetical protein
MRFIVRLPERTTLAAWWIYTTLLPPWQAITGWLQTQLRAGFSFGRAKKLRQQKSPSFTRKLGLSGVLLTRLETDGNLFLAEQAGFEPAVGLTPRTLSRRVT